MGKIAKQVDDKLNQIEKTGGTARFISAGSETGRELREEFEDKDVIAGSGGMTMFSAPDEATLKYRSLPVMVEESETANFLSVTYINAQGQQEEL